MWLKNDAGQRLRRWKINACSLVRHGTVKYEVYNKYRWERKNHDYWGLVGVLPEVRVRFGSGPEQPGTIRVQFEFDSDSICVGFCSV